MALLTSSLVERREAPPPYVTGGRAPRKGARRTRWSVGPYVTGPGASRRSIPSFSRDTEKGEGRARQPEKAKSPGSVALARRAV